MKSTRFALILITLALASLACGLESFIPGGGGSLSTSSELWSDVPRMEGLGSSELELPLTARIFMETWMSAALSGGTGNARVAVFSTDKTATDIQGFYTNELMASNGWEASDESTCFSGQDQGVTEVGLFCVFLKEDTSQETGLMLLAVPEQGSTRNTLFFIRIQNQVTPSP